MNKSTILAPGFDDFIKRTNERIRIEEMEKEKKIPIITPQVQSFIDGENLRKAVWEKDNYSSDNILASGIQEAFKKINANRDETERLLSECSIQHLIIPRREILTITKIYHEIISSYEASLKKGGVIAEQAMIELEKYLDRAMPWKHKFCTGGLKSDNKSSIYYQSLSGMTIRIKRANIGLKTHEAVIRKVMENIVFDSGAYFPTDDPVIGSNTSEIRDYKFRSLLENHLNCHSDYKSRIDRYYKNGKLFFVNFPFAGQSSRHDGNQVAEIMY
jgi:hypothetical protein